MARQGRTVWFAGALLASSLTASPTAEAASGGMQISYRAATGCPTQGDFASSLSARVSRLALTNDANRMLSVNIVETAEGYRGELRLFLEGTLSLERVLADRDCAALAEALALIAAMELRPSSSATSPQMASSAAVAPELTNSAATNAATVTRPVEFQAAAVVGVSTAPTPDPLLTLGINGAIATHRGPGHWDISVLYGQTGFSHYPNGEARFRWLSARVDACPLGFVRENVAIFPCALGEFGLLRGEARQVADARSRNGLWFAPGLGILGSIGVREFRVEGLVGVVRPLVRDRFLFVTTSASEQAQELHRAGSVGLVGELRFGWRF